MSRRICVVTGSRAEYGLLYWVLKDLQAAPDIELQLVVTGMHLAPEFGLTVREIENDGFPISHRVEMLVASDTPGAISSSMALGVIGMSGALEHLKPEIVLVLGDRFEILAVVQACLVHNVPVAHIAGGDTTEGAIDESIRHAITKMAHVHFVTNEQSAQRVCQMGEDPQRVHVVGSPGLDHLRRRALLDRPALEAALQERLGERNFLVTFHPVTLQSGEGTRQMTELLSALDAQDPATMIWITHPNADAGGRALAAQLKDWAAMRTDRVRVRISLGHLYLSLLAQVDAVIGNSSSGLYEAPSLRVPTVDIGERQRGRLAASSVIHCDPERQSIIDAIERALSCDCRTVVNPYGDGQSAGRIVGLLRTLPSSDQLLRKSFRLMEPGRV